MCMMLRRGGSEEAGGGTSGSRLPGGAGGAPEPLQPDQLLERRCKRTRPVRSEVVPLETASAAGKG